MGSKGTPGRMSFMTLSPAARGKSRCSIEYCYGFLADTLIQGDEQRNKNKGKKQTIITTLFKVYSKNLIHRTLITATIITELFSQIVKR